jgi:hypothetical protein
MTARGVTKEQTAERTLKARLDEQWREGARYMIDAMYRNARSGDERLFVSLVLLRINNKPIPPETAAVAKTAADEFFATRAHPVGEAIGEGKRWHEKEMA